MRRPLASKKCDMKSLSCVTACFFRRLFDLAVPWREAIKSNNLILHVSL